MFVVEALQPLYHEERIKAAKESSVTSCASTPGKTSVATESQQPIKSQGPCPKTHSAALNRQQSATRSTGFFGATFRTLSGTATPTLSRAMTPAKEKSQADIDALIAEKKRDADIVRYLSFLWKTLQHVLTINTVLHAVLVNGTPSLNTTRLLRIRNGDRSMFNSYFLSLSAASA
jgi:hypothetical protein